jgi:hypothetical protein
MSNDDERHPIVWRRTFATEELCDVAYERLVKMEQDRDPTLLTEADRRSGTEIEITISLDPLDELMHDMEVGYTPPEGSTPCSCGHNMAGHDTGDRHHDMPCKRKGCACEGFDRADWP